MPSFGGWGQFLKNGRALWLFVPLLLAGLTISFTLLFSRRLHLDPLTLRPLAPEAEVSLRLNQEKLVPPPSLPPSMFVGLDRPHLETADRDWNHLDPEFVQVVLTLFARMSKRGYPMALLEGYRSPERQEMLADKGSHVTQARAFQSKHQFRIAADVAPMRDGRIVISERDPWAAQAYQVLGEESAALGLIWGGKWAMRDLGHIESAQKTPTRGLSKGS